MTVPTVYRSSDASAPVLTGNAGSLVAVLDGCLVNGYGSKAAAGWTKSFSGTNAASYRQGGGCLFYLDVNDNNPNATSLGKEAAIRGYEAMTALATGTNPFPTVAQIGTPGLNARKSSATGTTPIAWVLIADDRTFYMCALTGDLAGAYGTWGFGDYYGFKSGDAYKCFIKSAVAMNIAPGSQTPPYSGQLPVKSFGANAVSGLYLPRGNAGTAGAITAGQSGLGISTTINATAAQPFRQAGYPNPSDSGIYLGRYLIVENPGNATTGDIRGYLRGFWEMLNSGGPTMSDKDTFSGTGDLAGRSFVVVGLEATANAYMAFETTAWDTSA